MHVYKLVQSEAMTGHYRSHVTLRAGPDRGREKEDLPESRINQSYSEFDPFKFLVPFEYFFFPSGPKVVTNF